MFQNTYTETDNNRSKTASITGKITLKNESEKVPSPSIIKEIIQCQENCPHQLFYWLKYPKNYFRML